MTMEYIAVWVKTLLGFCSALALLIKYNYKKKNTPSTQLCLHALCAYKYHTCRRNKHISMNTLCFPCIARNLNTPQDNTYNDYAAETMHDVTRDLFSMFLLQKET